MMLSWASSLGMQVLYKERTTYFMWSVLASCNMHVRYMCVSSVSLDLKVHAESEQVCVCFAMCYFWLKSCNVLYILTCVVCVIHRWWCSALLCHFLRAHCFDFGSFLSFLVMKVYFRRHASIVYQKYIVITDMKVFILCCCCISSATVTILIGSKIKLRRLRSFSMLILFSHYDQRLL